MADKFMSILDYAIGKQLRVKRNKRGLTLENIGGKLGISHQQVQKYEKGQTRVPASVLYFLTRVYDVSIEQFFAEVKRYTQSDSSPDIKSAMNILIVDNNPDDEIYTRRILEKYFPTVNLLCVHDYSQALDVLRYKTLCPDFTKPDLILLDVSVGKKNGLQLLKDIKRDRLLQEIPVVAITNNLNPEVKLNAYRFGVAGYICKSFEYESYEEHLVDCIRYWTKTVLLP